MVRLIAAALILSTVSFSASAERPKREPPEKSAEPRDKVLCKRFTEIGSLVATKRVCKTKAEWDDDRDNLRRGPVGQTCRVVAQTGVC